MNAKLFGAVLIGLLAGLLLQGTREQAQAQRPLAPRAWEYKVIPLPRIRNLTQQNAAEKLAKEYGTLGAEGWEYVGECFAGFGQQVEPYFAIFKRPRD